MSTPQHTPLCVVIMGASGDLSRKKLLPALFALFCNGHLPERFHILGFARSDLDDGAFRHQVAGTLTSRFEPSPDVCDIRVGEFLQRCHYQRGTYTDPDDARALGRRVESLAGQRANKLVYMAIPPTVFLETARSLREAGFADENPGAWSRVVVEKPFGRDLDSSRALTAAMEGLFLERQTYRIDHYLGKEVIQNLLMLRFGNRILSPLWNREHIERVEIVFAERIGVAGRAGYFDQFGIIRDVVQNHLLQILALIAMEQPISASAIEIAEEKAKVLRATTPMTLERTVLGQYRGYLDDPGVPADSTTETYVRTEVEVVTPRWAGVPFVLQAGKAVDSQQTEILIHFRATPASPYRDLAANVMRIRVQPDEAIELVLNNKVPGMEMRAAPVALNMLYHEAFDEGLPEAYERLLLDVIRGERSLFIQVRELEAAWQVVTPLLDEIATAVPLVYEPGSAGPSVAHDGARASTGGARGAE